MSPPLLVLGTGGSGTRVAGELMLAAGVYLGPERNRASDSRQITRFLRLHSRRYLDESGWVEAMGSDQEVTEAPGDLLEELHAAVERMLASAPDGAPWGWKNPPSIYVLPLLDQAFPDAPMVQFVRDGRDMAYSTNQNQLEVYGEQLLPDLADEPNPVRSIALWSRVNLAALSYARKRLGSRHLVLRYEDVCERPRAGATRLLEHLGLPVTDAVLDQAEATIAPSPTTGRWQEAPADEREAIAQAGAAGLAEFGYASEPG